MIKISSEIISFFQRQEFIVVSTLDAENKIHSSIKGLAGIEESRIYLIDLYRGHTLENLKKNPTISITAIDGPQFLGYTLKGKARIIGKEDIGQHHRNNWQSKVIQRMTKRVIRDVKKDKKSPQHPEARFPEPEYLIEMTPEAAINLTPRHLKEAA
ncbi:MAG: pyridoxamine 5'-phosphate oxidase family protein [Candidatus Omnitrophota bacterium]|jgi:predicted pyridoxine 5'-phosphate oxidase superfamily flavin-nucleotide-binding protein